MGADIHFVIEARTSDYGWVGTYTTDVSARPKPRSGDSYSKLKSRNYAFFAMLAGVRGEGPEPLGLPDDVSDLAAHESDGWGDDGHSHSYCSLLEFVRKRYITEWRDGEAIGPQAMRDALAGKLDEKALYEYMDYPPEDPKNYRVVFWFDN